MHILFLYSVTCQSEKKILLCCLFWEVCSKHFTGVLFHLKESIRSCIVEIRCKGNSCLIRWQVANFANQSSAVPDFKTQCWTSKISNCAISLLRAFKTQMACLKNPHLHLLHLLAFSPQNMVTFLRVFSPGLYV